MPLILNPLDQVCTLSRPGFAEIGSIKFKHLQSLVLGNQSALEDDWETSPVDGNRRDETGQTRLKTPHNMDQTKHVLQYFDFQSQPPMMLLA